MICNKKKTLPINNVQAIVNTKEQWGVCILQVFSLIAFGFKKLYIAFLL